MHKLCLLQSIIIMLIDLFHVSYHSNVHVLNLIATVNAIMAMHGKLY